MKRFLFLFLIVFTLTASADTINGVPTPDTSKHPMLRLVYNYTHEADDTIRFPVLMQQYNDLCRFYRVETVPAKMGKYGLEKVIQIYDHDKLIGTMYGIASKSLLIKIYQEYFNISLSTR